MGLPNRTLMLLMGRRNTVTSSTFIVKKNQKKTRFRQLTLSACESFSKKSYQNIIKTNPFFLRHLCVKNSQISKSLFKFCQFTFLEEFLSLFFPKTVIQSNAGVTGSSESTMSDERYGSWKSSSALIYRAKKTRVTLMISEERAKAMKMGTMYIKQEIVIAF